MAPWLMGLIDIKDFVVVLNNQYFLLSIIVIAMLSRHARWHLEWAQYEGQVALEAAKDSLESANQQLLSLDEAKSRFFANASHELRTPLVSLSAGLQMVMEEGGVSERHRGLMETSQQSLEDMLENINDILLKARAERGELDVRWAEVDVGSFVERSLGVFWALAEQQRVQLRFVNELPAETKAYVDRRHIRKIINNLVGNALKFTARDSVKGDGLVAGVSDSREARGFVEVCLGVGHLATGEASEGAMRDDARGEDRQGGVGYNAWTLSVRDTGAGIPAQDLGKIFDAFVQASNNQDRVVQGSGLGLSLVKDLVTLQQGTVTAESELGVGSIFRVMLPLGEGHVDVTQLDGSEWSQETDTRVNLKVKDMAALDLRPFEDHQPGRPRVLIVEDTPQVVQALGYALRDSCNLFFAADGEEGLARTRALMPDLVISDIMMPKMNGYELARDMKQDPQVRHIPLVLLTSKTDKASRIEGLEAGADEYLAKPFDNREIRVRIRGLLERKRFEAQALQSEKLASLGRLARGLAHEINNPLVCVLKSPEAVRRSLQLVVEGRAQLQERMPLIDEDLGDIEESGRIIRGITEALHGFARPGEAGFAHVDLHRDIDATMRVLKSAAEVKGEVFARDYRLEVAVECVAGQMNQVWMNLLQNALHAVEGREHRKVTVRTYHKGAYAFVAVEDNGMGIPTHQQDAVFDFLFTTKPHGKGSGMGLYHARQVVEQHGGTISLESEEGVGTRFLVQLPIDASRRSAGTA